MVTFVNNLPIRFGDDEDDCVTFDERKHCQMVQQTDKLSLIFKGSRCATAGDSGIVDYEVFQTNATNSNGWVQTGTTLFQPIGWSSHNFRHVTGNASTLQTSSNYAAGYWEIIFTVNEWNNTPLAGSFQVKFDGVTHSDTFDEVGTYIIYIESTSSGKLQFIPNGAFNGEITAIHFQKINTVYKLVAFNLNGTIAKQFTESLWSKYRDMFYFQKTWSELGLSNGCYYFKLLDDCDLTGQAEDNIFTHTESWSEVISGGCPGYSVSIVQTSPPPATTFDITLNTSACNLTETASGKVISGICYNVSFDMSITADENIRVRVKLGSATSSWFGPGTTDTTVSFTLTSTGTTFTFEFDGTHAVNPGNIIISNISLTVCEEDRIYSEPSNCYDLKTVHDCTKQLSWTNDDDAFGIPYSSLGMIHNMRLYAIKDKPKYIEESDIFEYSTGRKKILFAKSEKVWRLFFDYIPEYMHDAIRVAKIHDHFYVDGIEYHVLPGNYQPEWRGNLRLAQGQLEIRKVTEDNKNYNCS